MKIWEREGYRVEEKEFDHNLHAFDVVKGEKVVATITPGSIEDMEQVIEDLNNGEDVDGWEDGRGNTISIENNSQESLSISEMDAMSGKELREVFYHGLNAENRQDIESKAGFELDRHLDRWVEMYEEGASQAGIADDEQYVDFNEYYESMIEEPLGE